MSRDLTVHNLCIFGSRDREREGFNMTDLEALVSSRGEGDCAIYGLGMFHSQGYGFQALYSRIGYKESLCSRIKLINWLKILV